MIFLSVYYEEFAVSVYEMKVDCDKKGIIF